MPLNKNKLLDYDDTNTEKTTMTETIRIFGEIDKIIEEVDRFKIEPLFSEGKNRR
jgi:hypothetical protein